MSDGADKSLDIEIKLKADAAGGKQAEQSLDSLKAKTKSVTDANIAAHQSEQNAILAKLTATENAAKKAQTPNRNAQDNFGKIYEGFLTNKDFGTARGNQFLAQAAGMKAAGAAAAGASTRINGLGLAITRVARAMGLSGVRGGAQLFTLLGSAVTVAYIAFQKFMEVIKEIGDQALPEMEPLINAMEEVREKTYQAEAAQRAYFRELQRTLNLPETEAERAQVRKKYIQEVAKFEEDMAGQRHQRDIANLESVEASGLISHSEALRRKYAMDEEYNQRRLALELKQLDDELAAKRDERKADQDQLNQKGPALADAQNTQRGTEERVEKDKDKLDQTRKHRDELVKLIAELRVKENEALLDTQHIDITDPGGGLRKAKLEAIQGHIRGAQADLDSDNIAIGHQTTQLHAAEEANDKATESMKFLEGQVNALAEAINKLNIEITHDEASTARHKTELTGAAAAAKQARDADIVAAKAKEEAAAGIAVGSAGSALRFDPASAAAYRLAIQRGQKDAPLPTVEFDPNKVDARTGLPVNPGQARNLRPWEPGAQAQYDARRFGAGAPSGEGIDPGKYPAEVQPLVQQHKRDFVAYHNMVVSGFQTNGAELKSLKDKLARELEVIRSQLQGIHNK